MGVKLHNAGKRTIEFAQGKFFRPGQKVEFSEEVAARLQRLYPHEMQSEKSIMEAFQAAPVETYYEDEAPAAPAPKASPAPIKTSSKGDDKPAV